MRSRLLVAALIASAAAVSGCLEQERVLLIRPDGSATLTERTLLSAQTVQMMKSMGGGMAGPNGQAAPDPFDKMVDKKELTRRASQMGEGVTLSSAKKIAKDDGRAGSEVVFEIKDVNKLKLNMQQDMNTGGGNMRMKASGGSDEQPERVKLSFVKSAGGSPAKLTMVMPEPKKTKPEDAPAKPEVPPEMKAQMDAQAKVMMKMMCAGMRMSMVIKTAGKITKTNASYPLKDGSGVTVFDMNLGKLVQDDEAFAKMSAMDKDMSFEDAKKALSDPLLKKYMHIETKPKIEIEFK